MEVDGCENSLKQPSSNGVWFVYGSLKPSELGFRQIKHLIDDHEPARLDGYRIWIRDGLPGLKKEENLEPNRNWVEGHLLCAKEGKETELNSVIKSFETEATYKFDNVEASNSSDVCVTATATFFRRDQKSDDVFESPTWSISDDVYFRYGLPTLFRTVHESKKGSGPSGSIDFWQEYLPIMGSYMNLWTVLERYIQFTQPGLKPNNEKARFCEQCGAARNNEEKGAMTSHLRAIESSDAGKKAYGKVIQKNDVKVQPAGDHPRKQSTVRFLLHWRTARNNSVHRGKSAHSDYQLVRKAALGLSEFLVALLSQEVNGLEHLQEHLADSDSFKS